MEHSYFAFPGDLQVWDLLSMGRWAGLTLQFNNNILKWLYELLTEIENIEKSPISDYPFLIILIWSHYYLLCLYGALLPYYSVTAMQCHSQQF